MFDVIGGITAVSFDGVFACLCFDGLVGDTPIFKEFMPFKIDGVRGVFSVGRERLVGVLGLYEDIVSDDEKMSGSNMCKIRRCITL